MQSSPEGKRGHSLPHIKEEFRHLAAKQCFDYMHDNFVEQWKDVMVCATSLHLQNIALTLLLFGCQADVKSRAEILGILWLLDGATSGVKIENIVSVCKTQCNGLRQTVQRAVSDPGC